MSDRTIPGNTFATHLQERETDNEQVFQSLTTTLFDEFTSSGSGTAGSDEVALGFHSALSHSPFEVGTKNSLNNDAVLSGLDGIGLHLELVHSVFLLIGDNVDLSGQLSPLSDWHKGGTETKSKNGSEKEASSVQTDNDVDLARGG